jgi:hypothetical protein
METQPARLADDLLVGAEAIAAYLGKPSFGLPRDMCSVTGGVNPRIDGEACAGEDRGAAEAPGLFDGMAIQNDGLSVVSSG